MVSVRTINVSGIDYLQVVEYTQKNNKNGINVIKSFGRNTLENRMKAEQFAGEYERLKNLVNKHASSNKREQDNFLTAALTIFGIILGGAIIISLIKDVFGD